MTDINEFLLNKLDKLDGKLDTIKSDQAEARIMLNNHEKLDGEIHIEVKKMGSELVNQSKLLSEYNQSLREHMRRTAQLEDKVEPIHLDFLERRLTTKLKMKTWKKVLAFVGGLGTLVAVGVGIAQLAGLIH